MLNRIIIMGRLTRDPELRSTPNGTSVASFTLAVDRDFKNKQTGEKETDFIDMIAWRSTAEFVARYFTKGRMAVVEGRLQIRLWEDRDGNKRKSAEVIADSVYFGDSKKDNDGRSDQNYPAGGYSDVPGGRGTPPSAPVYSIPDFTVVDVDGDLPFLFIGQGRTMRAACPKGPVAWTKLKRSWMIYVPQRTTVSSALCHGFSYR